jgi:hypothetical protein
MRHHLRGIIAVINPWLERLHLSFRVHRQTKPSNEFLRFAAKHASGNHLDMTSGFDGGRRQPWKRIELSDHGAAAKRRSHGNARDGMRFDDRG